MRNVLLSIVMLAANIAVSVNLRAVEAESFGFAAGNDPTANAEALQKAVDCGGIITVSKPGIYDVGRTVYIGSDTSLSFGKGVFVRKNVKNGEFEYVFLNKGALTRTYDKSISIDGLNLIVNNVDFRDFSESGILGLVGQVSFFYVKDLRITRFRCEDLRAAQFGIQVCTFEDLLIDDVIIRGKKDGIHLGRGKRFKISNGTFANGDDAIALNAHDYDISNPELGWIEDGVIENISDLEPSEILIGDNGKPILGYFCRILAGSWTDWKEGMKVQKSDTVVSEGRMYRVQMPADGKVFVSKTRPTHKSGCAILDGIKWNMAQTDVRYNAGVSNVIFKDIFLRKVRGASFSIHFDIGSYSRSFYPGAKYVEQENLTFQNVHVLNDAGKPFIYTTTPVGNVLVLGCFLKNNPILFRARPDVVDYGKTTLRLIGCSIDAPKDFKLIQNEIKGKVVELVEK